MAYCSKLSVTTLICTMTSSFNARFLSCAFSKFGSLCYNYVQLILQPVAKVPQDARERRCLKTVNGNATESLTTSQKKIIEFNPATSRHHLGWVALQSGP